jgi:hypothetical protein
MSEPANTSSSDDPIESIESEDTIRQHPQDPAEGPDPTAEEADEVPRVHTQDPAEG